MNKLDKLLAEYNRDCNEIAEQCVAEGYPAYGSNYELRCENIWESCYKVEYEHYCHVDDDDEEDTCDYDWYNTLIDQDYILLRYGHHMRPMLAVCGRYGVGIPDKYDRGVWISKTDVDTICKMMETDPTALRVPGMWNGKPYLYVDGTSAYRRVELCDFEKLFH